ncbi:hypothetical protein B1748_10690 [Paenibacillus sp. MY03]|uniref:extracellular solute-binding protein n=1 Tax=Paenibacillus sp. MY03 TaxID=302980 RepID=UPI000B3D3DFB|nr:extracellular solute-binding protein [Paenibacillus sp. MY03]OUS76562.1 hypothetical protein B1748_10690 [Paenibacillus sp. MY03]
MKRKRIVMTTIIFVLCVLALSACSNDKNGNKGSEATSSPAPSATSEQTVVIDPLGKYDSPISMTTVRRIDASMNLPSGQTYEKNVWSDAILEELGIDIKVQWSADIGQYDSKLNVTMASGDLPDLMRVNGQQLQQLVETDSIADLTEIFDQYASEETKKQFAVGDGIALEQSSVGGKLYALPNTASAIGGAGGPLIWVRADWMKKLNLPEPKTIEDFILIAKAFTNDDPDGNNMKDTYGFTFDNTVKNSGLSASGFFNSFHAYPGLWIEDNNGGLVYGSTLPEAKEALLALQQLYAEGVIDPEFTVKDAAKTIEMIASGKVGMINSAHFFGQLGPHQLKDNDPKSEWVPYPLPSIDNEPAKVGLNAPVLEYYVVRKGYEHPEAIVKLFNYVFEKTVGKDAGKETYDRFMYDPEDGSIQLWKLAPVFSNDATDLPFQQFIDAVDANDETLAVDPTAKLLWDNRLKAINGEGSVYGWALYYPAWKIFFDIMDKGLFVNDGFYGGNTPTMTDKSATLATMELEVFTKIIMGAVSIDEFDKFVKDWHALGGDQITKEVNEWKQMQ